MITHKRTTYDLVGLLGDMGGISGLLITLLAILVSPVSEHSFYIKAARKLFIAKSKK
jgi:MFS-type transporter involved in bile tolerance (Atg22 family)